MNAGIWAPELDVELDVAWAFGARLSRDAWALVVVVVVVVWISWKGTMGDRRVRLRGGVQMRSQRIVYDALLHRRSR